MNTSLHETTRCLKLRSADLSEQLGAQTTKTEELENKWEDSSYELSKTRSRNDKLESMLVETQSELQLHVAANAGKVVKGNTVVLTGSEQKTFKELQVLLLLPRTTNC